MVVLQATTSTPLPVMSPIRSPLASPDVIAQRRLPEEDRPGVRRRAVVGAEQDARAARGVRTVVEQLRHRRSRRVEVHHPVARAVVRVEDLRLGREAQGERSDGRADAEALRVERMRALATRIDPESRLAGRRGDAGALAVIARAAVAAVIEAVGIVRAEDVAVGVGPEAVGAAGAHAVEPGPRRPEHQRRAGAGGARATGPGRIEGLGSTGTTVGGLVLSGRSPALRCPPGPLRPGIGRVGRGGIAGVGRVVSPGVGRRGVTPAAKCRRGGRCRAGRRARECRGCRR